MANRLERSSVTNCSEVLVSLQGSLQGPEAALRNTETLQSLSAALNITPVIGLTSPIHSFNSRFAAKAFGRRRGGVTPTRRGQMFRTRAERDASA